MSAKQKVNEDNDKESSFKVCKQNLYTQVSFNSLKRSINNDRKITLEMASIQYASYNCPKMQRNAERCSEMQWNAEKCREMQRNEETC